MILAISKYQNGLHESLNSKFDLAELSLHQLAKVSSLFPAFRKCLKLQNWYQNILLCL